MDDNGEEDYFGGEGNLDDDEEDVAMEEGCTAACQDILGRDLVAFKLRSDMTFLKKNSLVQKSFMKMELAC